MAFIQVLCRFLIKNVIFCRSRRQRARYCTLVHRMFLIKCVRCRLAAGFGNMPLKRLSFDRCEGTGIE